MQVTVTAPDKPGLAALPESLPIFTDEPFNRLLNFLKHRLADRPADELHRLGKVLVPVQPDDFT